VQGGSLEGNSFWVFFAVEDGNYIARVFLVPKGEQTLETFFEGFSGNLGRFHFYLNICA